MSSIGGHSIADILNTMPQNSRQITSRAMKKLQADKKKYSPSKSEHIALTNSFVNVLKYGDFDALKQLFSEDIIVHTDGGGKSNRITKNLASRQ